MGRLAQSNGVRADAIATEPLAHTSLPSRRQFPREARTQLEEVAPAADQITEPDIPQARALLDEYIAAFGSADAAALERLLVEDVILEATPLRSWFSGRRACIPFLRDRVLGAAGDWRMLATGAKQPAPDIVTAVHRDPAHRP
jgi:RNA polymerase sigma-70 factor, ECF subfamily